MFDAGSAGTRAHAFQWIPKDSKNMVQPAPNRNKSWIVKSNIPLSSAATDENAIQKIFFPIIQYFIKKMPPALFYKTKIYIYATAGLRILPVSQQNQIIDKTYRYLSKNSPFKVKRKHIRIMSGAEEAIYGWLAVNHLLNFPNPSFGAIDMGGASMQFAYQLPSRSYIALKFPHSYKIKVHFKTYYIYALSLLGFGANEAMKRFSNNSCFPYQIPFPSSFSFSPDNQNFKYLDSKILAINNDFGDFNKCLAAIKKSMIDQKILLPQNFPPLSLTFLSMASFYYSNLNFKLPSNSTLQELKNKTAVFCETNYSEHHKREPKNPYLFNYCFFGTFQYFTLSGGLNYDFTNVTVYKLGNVNGAELSWAIGAMLKEAGFVSYSPISFWNTIMKQMTFLFMLLCFLFLLVMYEYLSKKRNDKLL